MQISSLPPTPTKGEPALTQAQTTFLEYLNKTELLDVMTVIDKYPCAIAGSGALFAHLTRPDGRCRLQDIDLAQVLPVNDIDIILTTGGDVKGTVHKIEQSLPDDVTLGSCHGQAGLITTSSGTKIDLLSPEKKFGLNFTRCDHGWRVVTLSDLKQAYTETAKMDAESDQDSKKKAAATVKLDLINQLEVSQGSVTQAQEASIAREILTEEGSAPEASIEGSSDRRPFAKRRRQPIEGIGSMFLPLNDERDEQGDEPSPKRGRKLGF